MKNCISHEGTNNLQVHVVVMDTADQVVHGSKSNHIM